MNELGSAFSTASSLILGLDTALVEIVSLSLRVSLVAVLIASIIGLPAGAALAVFKFPGRRGVVVTIGALMGLPPVVVGLAVYLALSRSGPLGVLDLLFTPTAMIIAQVVLIAPIVMALTRQIIETMWEDYAEQLRSLGAGPWRSIPTLLWDARHGLTTVVLAGFGRASAEVGAVMIVGGNINHATRVMTTAIALETSKGDLALAMGLGIVLMLLSLIVNAAVHLIDDASTRRA
jgi:tungstate transport system permease protein